jgi:hypothetical protein
MHDLFNGVWKIDVPGSSVWDPESESYLADEVGEELIKIENVDGVQNYEVLYGDSPMIRIGYTSRYDSPEWVRYEIREILGAADRPVEEQVAEFKARVKATGAHDRNLVVGECYGEVRMISVDERNEFRLARSPKDGTPQSMILRAMESDGNAYLASIMGPEGVIFRIRRFVRVAADSAEAARFERPVAAGGSS